LEARAPANARTVDVGPRSVLNLPRPTEGLGLHLFYDETFLFVRETCCFLIWYSYTF